MLAGTFSNAAYFGAQTLTASGGRDIFHLILDGEGRLVSFERHGGMGDDNILALDRNAFGEFVLQAVTTLDGRVLEPVPVLMTLDSSGNLLGTTDLMEAEGFDKEELPIWATIDDSEEDTIEDPGGI